MDPFAGVETFVRVVESGSFTAAAAALQTAKSSVSDTIRGLEDRLGVRLLDRTTRRVRPTEAGAEFYAHCCRLLEDARRAQNDVRARRAAPQGTLRIASPEGFAERFIFPGLPGFLARHRSLSIELVEGTAYARLVEENLDLAIRIIRAPEPSWVVRRIGISEVIVVASPGYLAAAGVPERPADLVRHQLIGFSPLVWRDTWALGGESVGVRPRVLTNLSGSLRAAALAGLGLTALPGWMVADALVAGALVQVLADHPAPPSGIYAVYPTNRLLTPAVRAFVDHLARDLRVRLSGAGASND
jgi:DNA-binding transcriptional LysR family regulator